MSFTLAGEAILKAVSAGLYAAGTKVIAASQEIVPVEFGTLKRSAVVEHPVIEGDRVSVTIGYGYGEESGPDGDTAAQYAVIVHENPEARHAPPTTFKYLERPAHEFEPELGPTIAAVVRERAG